MVVNLFEGLQRPANGTAISLKFDTSHMDNFLEKLLHGAWDRAAGPAPTHTATAPHAQTNAPLPARAPLDACPSRLSCNLSALAPHRSAAVKATDDEVQKLREDNKRLNDEVAVLGLSACTR